jgi:hypothetical protein
MKVQDIFPVKFKRSFPPIQASADSHLKVGRNRRFEESADKIKRSSFYPVESNYIMKMRRGKVVAMKKDQCSFSGYKYSITLMYSLIRLKAASLYLSV